MKANKVIKRTTTYLAPHRAGWRVIHNFRPLRGLAAFLALSWLAGPGLAWAQPAGGILTEKAAIEMALRQHPSVRESQEKAEASRELIGVSQAPYFPQVSFGYNYFFGTAFSRSTGGSPQSFSPPGVASSLNQQASNFFTQRFSVSQLIYDFGKTSGNVASSRATYHQSREDYATTRATVVLNARTAFFGYLAAIRALKVTQETVRQNQELLKQAQGFYQVGIRAKIDVTKAEANLYDAESNLIKARNLVDVSRITLMNALGLKSWPFSDLEDIMEVTHQPRPLGDLREQALARRPEVLKNRYQLEANQASLKVARAGYYPTLSSSASYGWQGERYPLQEQWWVGLGVTFPLFEGFTTTHSVRSAKATIRATTAGGETLRQDIVKEVEQSYLDLRAAWELIRATAKALEAARENFRLAQGRYKVGVGSIIEVTDAQVQLFQADLKHVQALYDHRVAEAKLDKAVGEAY